MFKNLEPLSPSSHGSLKLIASRDFSFASGLMLAELVAAELAQAIQNFPLAFTKQDGRVSLGALLSITPGRNLFVGKDGKWLAGYTPATLRAYPFISGEANAEGQAPMLIDIESGRFSEKSGQPLFTKEGSPSDSLQQIIGFIGQLTANRSITERACAALDKMELLAPWQIQITTGNETASLTGLYRIDETALNALAPEDFLQLRQSGALPLAYAQMLSMGRLGLLEALAKQHVQNTAKGKQLLGQCFDLNKADGNSFKF